MEEETWSRGVGEGGGGMHFKIFITKGGIIFISNYFGGGAKF